MAAIERRRGQLRRGQYLGDVSALCFLHLPANLSPLPLLLAGTGSEILVYDLESAEPVKSFEVFEGIRVHGISLDNFNKQLECSAVSFRVSIYGERRVKLFNLRVELGSPQEAFLHLELTLIHSLPKFGHWVLDVCFLKDGATASEDACYLAIGCSDNAVCFWDISRCILHLEVKSTERCLLYSMRMFGDQIDSLSIASGTIFNEIVVWKLMSQNRAKLHGNQAEDHEQLTSDEGLVFPGPDYSDALVSRLVGHEGSIFRIAWFSNGKKLVSVSDDRSARIWEVQVERGTSCNSAKEWVNLLAGPVLFGHNARIWDCCIFESLIITAGEDCTLRVWDHDGRELNAIKEHIGRGVWRCLCDPSSSLLVTAGFDSAIKLHQLRLSSKGLDRTVASEDLDDREETFAISIPRMSGQSGLTDSKSEYIRCLKFSHEDSLYVATNNGYLYHVSLFNNKDAEWTELAHISGEAPIICMDLLSNRGFEDWVAIGDGKGRMTTVHIVRNGWKPEVEFTFTWTAEEERHLLSTHWYKSPEARFIFTADPGGRVKLWKLCYNFPSDSLIGKGSNDALLVAEYTSCFGKRIMCLDASFDEELLVCGDIRGNLLLFSLPRALVYSTSVGAEEKASAANYFKGAHGVSSVNSVSISSLSSDQVEICSTGADGCICYFQHEKDVQGLEFIGMKQVKELSSILSVFTTGHSDESAVGKYAVGFASANFIIWNLTAGTKVLQITCGGWRRPHSYYLGHSPEMMNCFSFVKDEVIYIHRHWVPEHDRKIYPRNLHLQFHGREIHSLSFICAQVPCSADENNGLATESSWIATGCEDGTVRLTRYELGMENWMSSQHLGEHVGGSAVRSVCSVSKMHIFVPHPFDISNVVYRQDGALEGGYPFILISVGAKRVVTAWKQTVTTGKIRSNDICSGMSKKNENSKSGSLSFQWLSTDMPFRQNSYMKRQNTKEVSETPEDVVAAALDTIPNMEPNLYAEDNLENDWRYLDVTAFLVKEAGSRISVCFVTVACSDATVTLRALVLPFRLWFDVASLAPLSSPVLALQHIVIPKLLSSKENIQTGSHYLVVTGATDGSIGIWDLTECVAKFMRQIAGLETENSIEFQKRPRTGRGSQGGRRWRSIDTHKPKKKPGHCKLKEQSDIHPLSDERTESGNETENHINGTSETSMSEQINDRLPLKVGNQVKADDFSQQTSILPLQVLENIHQSGVNCLFVSEIKNQRLDDSTFTFYVVSGGDDQAINCLRCDLELDPIRKSENISVKIHCASMPEATSNCDNRRPIQNHQMKVSYLDKITAAHSSAVKGVWTDGIWVFSVGLDQRVRCWKLEDDGVVEFGHLIISVPEPEALDVKMSSSRNHYEIAVAGRGMQMIQFCPPDDENVDGGFTSSIV